MMVTRRRLMGVAFIAVLCLFAWFTVAVYDNVFTPTVKVLLRTDHIGNQLQLASDVKVRGLIIGKVGKISSAGDGAQLELDIQPDKVALLPSNVSARLLPKTLFGERYVSLVLPTQSAGGHLNDGSIIEQDRSSSAIELERVLDDLMPVLQAIRPEKLATTLTALSQALSGRGTELGQTLVNLNSYLGNIVPQLPNLDADISKVTAVSDIYNKAAPDLIQALSDLTTTSKTIADQQNNLQTLYAIVTTTSQDATAFLRANSQNLIQLVDTSQPTLDMLARYAPEYPCLLHQIANFVPRINAAFGKGTDQPGLHITLEVNINRGKYLPNQDEPKYQDDRGPRCYPLSPTQNFPQYPADGPVKDGSAAPAGSVGSTGVIPATTGTQAAKVANSTLGLPGSPQENAFLGALLAPSMGIAPADMPAWSGLLVGPLLRGTEVTAT